MGDFYVLKVKKLHPDAKIPTLAYSGDIAYDLYALEDCYVSQSTKVRTGIAVQQDGHGFLIRDRSSKAADGVFITGGVIDSQYRGEVVVIMTLVDYSLDDQPFRYPIKAGDKIAQMIPIPVLTGKVQEVNDLGESERGDKGFGSSGS